MWDWNQFWRDTQGPITQSILIIFSALVTVLVAILTYVAAKIGASKIRFHEAVTEDAKIDTVMKKADIIVPAVEQMALATGAKGPAKKALARDVMNRITANDISDELVEHVIERKIAEGNAEALNPTDKLDITAKLDTSK
jgi:hypothetical protein